MLTEPRGRLQVGREGAVPAEPEVEGLGIDDGVLAPEPDRSHSVGIGVGVGEGGGDRVEVARRHLFERDHIGPGGGERRRRLPAGARRRLDVLARHHEVGAVGRRGGGRAPVQRHEPGPEQHAPHQRRDHNEHHRTQPPGDQRHHRERHDEQAEPWDARVEQQAETTDVGHHSVPQQQRRKQNRQHDAERCEPRPPCRARGAGRHAARRSGPSGEEQ